MMPIDSLIPGLNDDDAVWLEAVLELKRSKNTLMDVISPNDRSRLLETAVRHFLVRAKNSATVSEAKQYLRLVEILAAEAVRLMVESHADIGSFLERVCRDFEHGDEQDEFARIYRDLQRGEYPV